MRCVNGDAGVVRSDVAVVVKADGSDSEVYVGGVIVCVVLCR